MENVYGKYAPYLPEILEMMMQRMERLNKQAKQKRGRKLYEHLNGRIKTQESMAEKCQRKGLELSTVSTLHEIKDAIALRLVCGFIDDIYTCVEEIRAFPDCKVVTEKDYVKNAKPNGYRSYHMILELTVPFEDVLGNNPGTYYVEIQLRTIAMDSWASLEHEMKYKHKIKDPERIAKELKRCADELASCDVTMQTIRQLIHEND